MLSTKLKEAAGNSADATLYVDDVFSTYLYTGNGSTQTITNGIDLAGKGGMVWIKNRSLGTTAEGNRLVDSLNSGRTFGWTNISESTNGRFDGTVNPFLSNGFTLDSTYGTQGYLTTGSNYAAWTFRKAAKFFDVQTVSHTNGTANTIDLSTLATVGMVIAKNTTTVGDWDVWHRSLTAGNNLQLNLTNAQSTTNAWLSVSGTTATLAASAPTGTYVIYAYAHDTSSTGIIQCGSFTTDASGNATVNLGWEPQYVLLKRTNSSSFGNWLVFDSMRGWTNGGNTAVLNPNLSDAESTTNGTSPNATGFTVGLQASSTYIYMAIRRPNKPPTSGTQVFALGDGNTSGIAMAAGFPTDHMVSKGKGSGTWPVWASRLWASTKGYLHSDSSDAQATGGGNLWAWDLQNSFMQSWANNPSITYMFKRAPGFFDVVCYTGTGVARTVAHNLGVAPELMIVKCRSRPAEAWDVYAAPVFVPGTNYTVGILNDSIDFQLNNDLFNYVRPTASVFSVGVDTSVNFSGATYVAYLFATLAGIQYINSYVGDGTTGRVINCGFSAGARFICIKATSTTGSWWVWDSARGITSTNDPVLQLNSTAAEITSADAIDPSSSGFIVNQEATCSINASGVSYLVWAIA